MLKTILLAGLLVGTLDISSAFVDVYVSSGKNPLLVLPYVASGVFGAAAFSGGTWMFWMGLLFHYLIAFCWTVAFFLVFARQAFWMQHPLFTGVVYGIIVWLIMNKLVVPLSNVPPRVKPVQWTWILKGVLILITMIGLPLAYIARGMYVRASRAMTTSS